MDQRRPHDAELTLLRKEARTLLGGNAQHSQRSETSNDAKGARHWGNEIRDGRTTTGEPVAAKQQLTGRSRPRALGLRTLGRGSLILLADLPMQHVGGN
jgi:hypothetical protein